MSEEKGKISCTGFFVYALIGLVVGCGGGFMLFMDPSWANFPAWVGWALIAGSGVLCGLIAGITGAFTWNQPPKFH
jgi:hypothetical protein